MSGHQGRGRQRVTLQLQERSAMPCSRCGAAPKQTPPSYRHYGLLLVEQPTDACGPWVVTQRMQPPATPAHNWRTYI